MRLCSGHPKAHSETIVESSWEGGGGVHGRSSGLPDYLNGYIVAIDLFETVAHACQ